MKEAIKYNGIESAIALLLSFVINLFVVSVFADAFSDQDKYPNASLRIAVSSIVILIIRRMLVFVYIAVRSVLIQLNFQMAACM